MLFYWAQVAKGLHANHFISLKIQKSHMGADPEVSCLMVLALYITILLSSAQKHKQSMHHLSHHRCQPADMACWTNCQVALGGESLWEPAFPNGKQFLEFGQIVSVKHLRLVLE